MKAVVDTCILLDFLQKREPFSKTAHDIVLASFSKRYRGFITAKSILDVHYILRKNLHNEQLTRDLVNRLFLLFIVVDTVYEDCRIAISSPTSDYEDAVMIETAKRIGADCIVTRNLRDYSASPVPAYSPEDFLKKLDQQK